MSTARWLKLESLLSYASLFLAKVAEIPLIRPFYPQALGYNKTFKHPRAVREQARLSRDWFVVWIGLLSYIIARVNYYSMSELSREGVGGAPCWFEILAAHGFPQDWLGDIYSSLVCSFSPNTPRAGVFVHAGEYGRDQPSIEFFCEFNVPIWYPWGSKQAKWAQDNPWFAAYGPLPHQLQAATTTLVQSPTQPPCSSEATTPVDRSASTSTKKACQTWQDFFAGRQKRHAEMEKHESPSNRQRRLDRERKPPIKRCKVFRWLVSVDPQMDSEQRIRTPVTKAENEEWIDFYGSNQKRYDAWENEWDLCSEFGDGDDFDHDELDDMDYIPEIIDPNLHDAAPSPHQTSQQSPPPPLLIGESSDPPPALSETNFFQILAHHYGFVPPLTTARNTAAAVDQVQWNKCMLAIGLRQVDGSNDILTSPFDHAVLRFIQNIIAAHQPAQDEWDLHNDNHMSLATAGHIDKVSCLNKETFLFRFPQGSVSFQWKLALTSPISILYVCRLYASLNLDQYNMARRLVEQGIAFRTLLPLQVTPSLGQSLSPLRLVPIRLSGYKFTAWDYGTYRHQRDAILSSPRGRAALLRGGIIWRLAKDTLSLDGALQGPSMATTVHGDGFSLENVKSGVCLWDDDLTVDELKLISGTYSCYTGHGSQIAVKSWWPPPWVWDGCGENFGRWTERNEQWYQKRLMEIQDGAEPLPSNKWRDRLRGSKEARLFNQHVLNLSQTFLCLNQRS